jgi:hypothetical protein
MGFLSLALLLISFSFSNLFASFISSSLKAAIFFLVASTSDSSSVSLRVFTVGELGASSQLSSFWLPNLSFLPVSSFIISSVEG